MREIPAAIFKSQTRPKISLPKIRQSFLSARLLLTQLSCSATGLAPAARKSRLSKFRKAGNLIDK